MSTFPSPLLRNMFHAMIQVGPELWVRVTVQRWRRAFGRLEFWVHPDAGAGGQWVTGERLLDPTTTQPIPESRLRQETVP